MQEGESSEEEPDEFGRIPKKKVPIPFNAISLTDQAKKRLKILRIRQNKGDLIRASSNNNKNRDGVIDNVFRN